MTPRAYPDPFDQEQTSLMAARARENNEGMKLS